ncbi:VCBS repeat-containing protein, partial [Arthrobacter sp. ISL-5]|uniref:FG-GAP repeat domain-containing protein n=1 Tax=Arthrobacter sp. ISL-5 TaxID=2819111 RepID=UPI001BE7C9DD
MTALDASGDLTGDGKADLVARDSSGVLYIYPGTGSGGFGSRIRLGSGWNAMTALDASGDLTGDGKADLVARDCLGEISDSP